MSKYNEYPIGIYFWGHKRDDKIYSSDFLAFLNDRRGCGFPICSGEDFSKRCRCSLCRAFFEKGLRLFFSLDEVVTKELKNFVGSAFGRKKFLIDYITSGKLNNMGALIALGVLENNE